MQEAPRNTGDLDRRDVSSSSSEEKDEDEGKCFASYYPVIGVLERESDPQAESAHETTALEHGLESDLVAHYFDSDDPETGEPTEQASPRTQYLLPIRT